MKIGSNKDRFLATTLLAGVASVGVPALVAGTALLAPTAASADAYTSVDFSGRVVDASGAPVNGATVTLVSNQGTTRTATTGANGEFRLNAVPVGAYTVSVQANGFSPSENNAVSLAAGSSAYSFTLAPVGSEEVVVTAARVMRDFSRTDTGTVFNVQDLAKEIPLGRSINSAVLLTPSAGLADPSIAANGVRRNQTAVSLSGTSAAESVYYINGLNVTDQRTFLGYADLPFEFIQSIETKTGGYQAEFGRGTGAVVNIVTRSGSNDFHWGASAYWTPDSLRGDHSQVAYAPGGSNSVGQVIYNRYSSADSNEQTIWASGAIIPDHVFFFGLYNPRDNDSWSTVGYANPISTTATWQHVKYNDPRWGAKLDFVLNENHRLEVTLFDDSTTTDYEQWNVLRSTGQIGALAGITYPNGQLPGYNSESGGLTQIYHYTGNFTDWFTLSLLYGRNESSYRDFGAYTSTPGVTDNANYITPGRQAGPFNQIGEDTRDTYRADADFYFPLMGDHHLRVGYDREDLLSTARSSYSGGALYNGYTACSSLGITNVGHPDGCVDVITFSDVGDFNAEQSALYVQDSWQVTSRLSLELGLRQDIYDYKNRDGQSYIKIDDQFAPRLGFSWDVSGDGTTTITGSVGDYYLPIATNTSIRASSGEVYNEAIYNATRSGGNLTLDANGAPVLGSLIAGPFYYSPPAAPPPQGIAEQDLKPMYEREFTLGLNHDFTEGRFAGWSAGVHYTHRNLEQTIEDTAIGDALDRYCQRTAASICSGFLGTSYASYYPYVLVNPGDGARVYVDMEADSPYLSPGVANPAFNPVWVNLTAADMALPKAERTYDAVTFDFERPFDGHWGLKGSYTWAHSRGNYEGAVKSDVGQTDASITQDFDHASNEWGANGDLPNDRRHTFHLYGTYSPVERLTIGANFTLQSGRPYGCIGTVPSSLDPYAPQSGTQSSWYCPKAGGTQIGTVSSATLLNQFAALGIAGPIPRYQAVQTPRGDSGTTDWVSQLDLSFAYRIYGDADRNNITATMDIFNVFDQDAVTRVNETGAVRTGATGQKGIVAPFYGLPRTYQAPRSVRFGLRYQF
ncbi:MAG TPA: TonB-dependent receptor [Caulobacterales bacterium]|nr:TonB-dependent receptor [Caulobacterales bacterium]